jgi:phenylpropionate dioxygenase-like ring-hydroxylating dioxygenase large terminal subunit
MQDLFNPAHYANVRRSVMEANHLPRWCYTSQEFYDREVERIFMKEWNFIGRADHIPNPGDYFTLDFVGTSVIVIRQGNGGLRAFANTCTHRGTRLLSGEGNCKSIACPYHSWVFSQEGALIAARGMEKTQGFDKAAYGLTPVKLETWGGFLFLNFDPSSKSLGEFLGDLPDKLGSYRFSDMVCVRRKEYDLACNWKVYVENAMEEYHTATVHRATVGTQKSSHVKTRGDWEVAHLESEKTIAILPGETTTFPHIDSLDALAASGTNFALIYPSTMWGCTQDCMWWLELRPQGPARTKLIVGSCFPQATIARSDFTEVVQKYYRRWDKSIPEDNQISEEQQLGLSSPFCRTGRVSSHEVLVHSIANWVLDRVL